MSYACPHCHRSTITAREKLFGTPHSPVRCKACGGLSAEPATPNRVASGLLGGAMMAAPWLAIAYSSWWPVIAYLAMLVLWPIAALRWLPLLPLTEAAVEREWRLRLISVAAIAVIGVVVVILGRP